MVGFGTGFTGRAGMGKKPLSLASMRTHITQVKALLRGDVADIDGGLAQILALDDWLPNRPINVPIYMAGQGPKARALAKEITDGLISLGGPAEGFETCLVSTNGTVLDDGEDVTSPHVSTALKPIIALAYHHRYTTDPETVKSLPNGEAWLASVERVAENVRHLSVHRGHNLDVSNGHDPLVDVSAAKQMTFTGTREELRERLPRVRGHWARTAGDACNRGITPGLALIFPLAPTRAGTIRLWHATADQSFRLVACRAGSSVCGTAGRGSGTEADRAGTAR
jgi:5,10-methylenetetrahydromethanopterin reductase